MGTILGLILLPLIVLAAFAAVIFVPMLPFIAVAFAQDMRRTYRRSRLLCEACAYDLRGSREAGKCPECGKRFSKLNYPAAWPNIGPNIGGDSQVE